MTNPPTTPSREDLLEIVLKALAVKHGFPEPNPTVYLTQSDLRRAAGSTLDVQRHDRSDMQPEPYMTITAILTA